MGFVDSAKRLGGDPKYFINYVHYTKEGIIALAENYADYIIAHKVRMTGCQCRFLVSAYTWKRPKR